MRPACFIGLIQYMTSFAKEWESLLDTGGGGGGGTQFISLAHPLARYALESLPSENVHIKDL